MDADTDRQTGAHSTFGAQRGASADNLHRTEDTGVAEAYVSDPEVLIRRRPEVSQADTGAPYRTSGYFSMPSAIQDPMTADNTRATEVDSVRRRLTVTPSPQHSVVGADLLTTLQREVARVRSERERLQFSMFSALEKSPVNTRVSSPPADTVQFADGGVPFSARRNDERPSDAFTTWDERVRCAVVENQRSRSKTAGVAARSSDVKGKLKFVRRHRRKSSPESGGGESSSGETVTGDITDSSDDSCPPPNRRSRPSVDSRSALPSYVPAVVRSPTVKTGYVKACSTVKKAGDVCREGRRVRLRLNEVSMPPKPPSRSAAPSNQDSNARSSQTYVKRTVRAASNCMSSITAGRGKGDPSSSDGDSIGSAGDDKQRHPGAQSSRKSVEAAKQPTDIQKNKHRREYEMKPPKFTGSHCIDEFLSSFENCAEYNEWDARSRVAHLKNCLQGTAAQLLRDSDKLTYDELVEKLQRRYGNRDQQEKFRTELRCLRRQRSQTLPELAEQIRKLMGLAFPGDPTESTKIAVARDAFLAALNDADFELKVREHEPADMDASCRIAMRLECHRLSAAANKPQQHVRTVQEESNATEGEQYDSREAERFPAHTAGRKEANYRQRNVYAAKMQPTYPVAKDAEYKVQFEAGVEQSEKLAKQNAEYKQQMQQFQAMQQKSQHQINELQKQVSRMECVETARKMVPPSMNVPAQSVSNPTVQATRSPAVGNGLCFRCQQPGHIARYCTSQKSYNPSRDTQGSPYSHQNSRAMCRGTRSPRSGYLSMSINGLRCLALLDTGSETSVFPAKFARGLAVRPSSCRLHAANGSLIPVIGEVDLPISIEGYHGCVRAILTDHVAEPMLGFQWCVEVGAVIRFGDLTLSIGRHTFKLKTKSGGGWCRRIVMQEDTVLPDHSECNLPTRLQYKHIGNEVKSVEYDWGTEPRQIAPGVYLSRTLLPERCTDIPVRAINLSGSPVTLKEGRFITELQPMQLIEKQESSEMKDEKFEGVVEELLSRIPAEVPQEEKLEVEKLIREYEPIFSKDENDLGTTGVMRHKIDIGDAAPFRQQLRRQPPAVMTDVSKCIDSFLAQGVIEPASSPFASNLCLVKKKDGSIRCCCDYRQLNSITKKDAYPLPQIDVCLDAMAGARWFSVFDLRSGYHQVTMNPADKEKTAFICHRGQFQFRVLPFGLTNAGATFQRLMDVVMAGLAFDKCLVYLDDIIVFSRDLGEHFERLRLVFDRIQAAGLKLKPSKCSVLQKSVSFLGHVISETGIATDPEKIRVVQEWPIPTTVKEVRAFLGLASYYRRFVRGFAEIAGQLHELTKKHARFHWDQSAQEAFQKIKEALTSPPVMSMPRDEGQYILDTDASDHSIGAVLSQIQDGEERVILYASKVLSKSQRNYCVTKRELLSLVVFLKRLRQYLLGRSFTVRTDNSAITWFRKTRDPIGQSARWLEVLEEFDFEIMHRPGTRHSNADAMSRIPCQKTTCVCRQNSQACAAVHQTTVSTSRDSGDPMNDINLSEAQRKDPELSVVIRLMEKTQAQPSWNEIAYYSDCVKQLWKQWPRLSLRNGVLCRRWESAEGRDVIWQVVMPPCLTEQFTLTAHEGMTGGHLGKKKTELLIQNRAYWPGWKNTVLKVIHRCKSCAQQYRGNPPRQTPLTPIAAGEPWETISIDITGPHPKSRKGNIYILTLVDHYSKWAEAFPIRDHTAVTVSRVLAERVFCRMGCPLRILSDQGREFESELFQRLCQLLQINKVRTTPYKPSTNAIVERFHRTLNGMLAKCVEENQRNWDIQLPMVMAAYRASVHSSTGYSPNRIIFGKENRMPVDLVYGLPVEETTERVETYDDYVEQFEANMTQSYELARAHLRTAAERRKRYYDTKVKQKQFHQGEWVWYYYPRRYVGRSIKWQKMYTGPFLVIRVIAPSDYVLQKSKRSDPFVVHQDKLKRCECETPQSWLQEDTSEAAPTNVEVSEVTPELEAEQASELGHLPETAEEVPVVDYESEDQEETEQTEVKSRPPDTLPARQRNRPKRLNDYVC